MPFKPGESGNPSTQFKPGQSGNPDGSKPGYKHISTHIQNMLNDEDFTAFLEDEGKEFKGAPLKAIIGAAIQQSLRGNDKAREWLAKYGYGQKFEVEHSGEIGQGTIDPVMAAEFAEFLKNKTKA